MKVSLRNLEEIRQKVRSAACRNMEPKPGWRLSLLRLRRDKKLRGTGPAGPAAPRVSARAAMREALGPTETFEPPPLPCGRGWAVLQRSTHREGPGEKLKKLQVLHWGWVLVRCLFQVTISSSEANIWTQKGFSQSPIKVEISNH